MATAAFNTIAFELIIFQEPICIGVFLDTTDLDIRKRILMYLRQIPRAIQPRLRQVLHSRLYQIDGWSFGTLRVTQLLLVKI
jgi:hypothetical protein